jgi:cytochrome P450
MRVLINCVAATLICGAIYLLLSNQDTLSMLTSAVRADFESIEDMTDTKLEQHEYLNAVLQESLRLYPPAPDMLFRSTMEETAVVAGQVVPQHTSVTMNLWAANRSASNFHRPTEFLPQRWLKSPPAAFNADNKSALNPFSIGPRNCIGMK